MGRVSSGELQDGCRLGVSCAPTPALCQPCRHTWVMGAMGGTQSDLGSGAEPNLAPVSPPGPTDRRTDGQPLSWGPPPPPSRHPQTWAASIPTRSRPTPTPRAAPSAPNCSRLPSPPCPAIPCGCCPARTRAAPLPRLWTSRWVRAGRGRPGALAAAAGDAGRQPNPAVHEEPPEPSSRPEDPPQPRCLFPAGRAALGAALLPPVVRPQDGV